MGLTDTLFTLFSFHISGRDLIMVGVALIGEGFEFYIPRGYIYFSMAFSIGVEILNMKMRKNRQIKLKLHKKVIN